MQNDEERDEGAPRVDRTSPLEEFAAALVARKMIEIREGATAKDLADALAVSLKVEAVKERQRAVLTVFESPLVDEIFVDDGELEQIVKHVSRQFG